MIVTPEQIQGAIHKWQRKMSDMSVEVQYKLSKDEKDSCYFSEVFTNLKALKSRDADGDYGPEAQAIYVCLDGFPDDQEICYFGYLNEKLILTQDQIEESLSTVGYTSFGDILIPYNNPDYKFLAWAVKKNQPIKTSWTDVTFELNSGQIGGGDNLFTDPVEVGDYNYYITNWSTIYYKPLIPVHGLKMS